MLMHQRSHHPISFVSTRGLALLGFACTLGLSSCKDACQSAGSQPSAGDQAASAQAPASVADAQQAELLNYMIYSVGEHARRLAADPAWVEDVRDMRNRLEEYYNSIPQTPATLAERVKLGLFLAHATRDLRAFQRAISAYDSVLQLWQELPDADRTSPQGRRTRSDIENGKGMCLMALGKRADALPLYKKALDLDKARFEDLAPENNAPLPQGDDISPDLVQAAEDVLSSYRCMGECQLLADDPESARDTYKKGTELAQRMKHLKPGMSIQYIRLLSSLGNLESSCGRKQQALAAWQQAAFYANQLQQAAPSPAVKAQAALFLRELAPSIKTLSRELQAEAAPQQEADAAPELLQ